MLRFVNNDFQENKEPTIGGKSRLPFACRGHPFRPQRVIETRSDTGLSPTAAFLTQKCTLPTRTIKFEIWDTAGQERFASLAPMYYRNAQAALVAYDLTKASSLIKARHWVAELQRQASPGIVIALVGNKLDLVEDESDGGVSSSGAGAAEGGGQGSEGEANQGEGANSGSQDDGKARKISTEEARAFAEEEGLLFFESSAKTGTNVGEVFSAIAGAIPETALKGRSAGGGGQGLGGSQQSAGGRDGARIDLGARAEGGKTDGCAC